MQAPTPSAYLQFAGLSVPLVEPCACRDLQSAPVTHCAGRLRCRNPFLSSGHNLCRARGETMRATKAYRANTNCRKLRMPQVETLYRCSPTVSSDPTIILRVGPRSVIRSNLMVGHATTILRRYTSGSDPIEWSVTEAKGTDLYKRCGSQGE